MPDRMWLSKLLGQIFLAKLAAEIPTTIALMELHQELSMTPNSTVNLIRHS